MTNMIMTNDRHALTAGWAAPVGAPAAAPLLCVRPMAVRATHDSRDHEKLGADRSFLLRPELGAFFLRLLWKKGAL